MVGGAGDRPVAVPEPDVTLCVIRLFDSLCGGSWVTGCPTATCSQVIFRQYCLILFSLTKVA